jgi:hypothetical protein
MLAGFEASDELARKTRGEPVTHQDIHLRIFGSQPTAEQSRVGKGVKAWVHSKAAN